MGEPPKDVAGSARMRSVAVLASAVFVLGACAQLPAGAERAMVPAYALGEGLAVGPAARSTAEPLPEDHGTHDHGAQGYAHGMPVR